MMPEMDGVEAMHRIKELEGGKYSEIPIAPDANAISGRITDDGGTCRLSF